MKLQLITDMKKIRAALFLTLSAAATVDVAVAQNFNPTVEVTNAYDVSMVDADKPLERMAVPDSLLKFDLDFDYSVLSNPYDGGYDFNPYFLEMKPEADAFRAGRFLLKAGAGYPVSVPFTLVWSPLMKKSALDVDVHAGADSYFGRYFHMAPLRDEEGLGYNPVGRVVRSDGQKDSVYAGRDARASFGVDLRHDWEKVNVKASLGYDGIFTKDLLCASGYNSVSASLALARNDDSRSHFHYQAAVDYRISSDDSRDMIRRGGPDASVTSEELRLSAQLGRVFNPSKALLVGLGMEMNGLRGTTPDELRESVSKFTIAPGYVFGPDGLRISLGVKLELPVVSGVASDRAAMHSATGQVLYPDVSLDLRIVPGRLHAYAILGGGLDINPYSSLKERNRFFNATMLVKDSPAFQNSSDKIDAVLGFRGNISSVFRFDLSGGFLASEGAVTEYLAYSGDRGGWYESFVTAGRDLLHADLKYALDLDSFVFDGSLRYTRTEREGADDIGFEEAPFSFNARARYDWNKRIFAGVHADGASRRRGRCNPFGGTDYPMLVPGYVNLGLDAEFAVSRKLSLWLKADNLLCQSVYRSPLHVRKGVNITGGICVNL